LKNKKVTIIGLNFYPESTAIGLYSTQLAQFLEELGAEINVVTAFPYYPQWEIDPVYKKRGNYLEEKLGTIRLLRYKQYTPKTPTFFKRVIHIIDFTIGNYFNLKKIKDCDYVISVVPFTSSAYLGAILSRRKKAKHWIHIQDFEFDAAFQSGLVDVHQEKRGWIYKFLMGIERRIFNKADCVSTISHTMVKKLETKTSSKTYFLPNWVDASDSDPSKSQPHSFLGSDKFKLLYSGNIGDKQDWNFFLEMIQKLDFDKYEVIIVGDGSRRKEIENKISSYPGISLHKPVPYAELSDLLCSADAHFLFQKLGVVDTVMPSKILGMMASARPSIITGHPDSEVRKVIDQAAAGVYISENNVDLVLDFLNTMQTDKALAQSKGVSAREYVLENFAKRSILERFANQLGQL